MEPLLLSRRLGLKRTLPGGLELEVLHDISLTLQAGEILAVAGESGSGKTSLARCLAGIDSPSSGEVRMNGLKLSDPKVYQRERLSICRQVQLIFQGFTAVNPDLTLRQVIAEPLRALRLCPKSQLNARVQRLALDCGLNAALLNLPAGELSGGQLQRAALARALAVNPRVLIADEPTAALDVLLQAQIVNFLVSLVRTRGMSLIFITHDLHLVRCLADRAMLLIQGRVVEAAPVPELLARPLHPYTQLLLRSLPCPEPAKARARLMSVGSIPQLEPDASLQEIYPGHWARLKNKP